MLRGASIWLSHLDGAHGEGQPEATAALPLRQNAQGADHRVTVTGARGHQRGQERLPVGAANLLGQVPPVQLIEPEASTRRRSRGQSR